VSFTNFLAERYAVGALIDTLQEKYPPAVVFIDEIGEHTLPEAIDKWADAHMAFVAAQPPSASLPWDKYRHRFLTERPARAVFLDLLKDLGVVDLLGIDVNEFITALTQYRAKKS
jgi:hypothetical protein